MVTKLDDATVQAELATLPGWTHDRERAALYRHIRLADFLQAFALMTRIALAAEKADHHPEWSNVYNRLDIWLTTHDAGGISARDLALARVINGFLQEAASPAAG